MHASFLSPHFPHPGNCPCASHKSHYGNMSTARVTVHSLATSKHSSTFFMIHPIYSVQYRASRNSCPHGHTLVRHVGGVARHPASKSLAKLDTSWTDCSSTSAELQRKSGDRVTRYSSKLPRGLDTPRTVCQVSMCIRYSHTKGSRRNGKPAPALQITIPKTLRWP